jgi:hypothetical protein
MYGTTGGIKHIETHNKTQNGRGAGVALYAHPTYTDTGVFKGYIAWKKIT